MNLGKALETANNCVRWSFDASLSGLHIADGSLLESNLITDLGLSQTGLSEA